MCRTAPLGPVHSMYERMHAYYYVIRPCVFLCRIRPFLRSSPGSATQASGMRGMGRTQAPPPCPPTVVRELLWFVEETLSNKDSRMYRTSLFDSIWRNDINTLERNVA